MYFLLFIDICLFVCLIHAEVILLHFQLLLRSNRDNDRAEWQSNDRKWCFTQSALSELELDLCSVSMRNSRTWRIQWMMAVYCAPCLVVATLLRILTPAEGGEGGEGGVSCHCGSFPPVRPKWGEPWNVLRVCRASLCLTGFSVCSYTFTAEQSQNTERILNENRHE